MNPDKLFDYLDGRLTPADRAAFEAQLSSDSHLLRQLAVARDIHRGMGNSRRPGEVVMPVDDPVAQQRSAKITRRIIIACLLLVFLNVAIGLGVIARKRSKPAAAGTKEAEIRQQLINSLNTVAQNALPLPSFATADILLAAPRAEWEQLAARVTAAAEHCSGTAQKGVPDDAATAVLVDIPASREPEFRQLVGAPVAASISPAPTAAPNERTIVQVRIAEAAR